MLSEDIEANINRICWGGTFALVKTRCGDSKRIIIKSLSLKDKNFVEFVYKQAFNEAVDTGIHSKFELQHEMKVRQLWGLNDDVEMKMLKDKTKELNDVIKKEKRNSRDKRIAKILIKSLEDRLIKLVTRKKSLLYGCAEEYANELKSAAVVFCSTFDENESKYWKNYDEFLKENDMSFIENIIKEINNIEIVEQKDLRTIARSSSWRFRWNAGKSQGNLFDKTILELDAEQQNLIYWSQVYDSVYEAYERPPQDIIEDDEKLDEWFKNQDRKEKTKNVSEGKSVSGIKLSQNVSRHGEIFIVANPDINPYAPTTQDVEGLNTSFVRKFKKAEEEKIVEKKLINEKDLRGRKNKIARRTIGASDAVIKGGNLGGRAKGGRSASKVYPGGTIG